jgi:hypothetical protein
LGRIVIVDDGQIIEPDELDPLERLPEPVDPYTPAERAALLTHRLQQLYSAKGKAANQIRTELLDSASRAISLGQHDLADSLFSVIAAVDLDLIAMVSVYLRELAIEAGQQGLWKQLCTECGCTDEAPCPGGCCWVEPGLCSACSGRLLDRLTGG